MLPHQYFLKIFIIISFVYYKPCPINFLPIHVHYYLPKYKDFINPALKINLIFNMQKNSNLSHDLKAPPTYSFLHLLPKVKEQVYFFQVKLAINFYHRQD
jgi:hypothetical protein